MPTADNRLTSDRTPEPSAAAAHAPAPAAPGGGPPIGRTALETTLFRFASLPLSLGVTVITTRFLLPEGRGAFVLVLLYVAFAATLLGNLNVSVIYHAGRTPRDTREIVRNAFALSVAAGAAGALLLLVLIDLVLGNAGYPRTSLAVLALPAMLVVQNVTGVLLATGRVRTWNFLQLVSPVAVLVAMLVLVALLDRGVGGAVEAWVTAQIAAAGFALYFTRDAWRPLGLGGLSRSRAAELLGLGIKAGLSNIVSLLNYRIELLLVQAFVGLAAVGIYSLAVTLTELLWLPTAALAVATIPRVVSRGEGSVEEVTATSVRHAVVVAGGGALALALVAPWGIPLLFGDAFSDSVLPLILLLPGAVAFAPARALGVYFTMRLGQARYPLWTAIVSAATTCSAAVLLIPPLGAEGAAIASSAGYVAGIGVELFWFLRTAGLPAARLLPRRTDLVAYRTLFRNLVRGAASAPGPSV